MFPVTFDRQVLEGLPYPEEDDITRVLGVLKTVMEQRVLPYFRTRRGTDPRHSALVMDRVRLERLEDDQRVIAPLSLLLRRDAQWIIAIHERLFDYLAFVLPGDSKGLVTEGSDEERRALAFAEFLLRHQMEHLLYPKTAETAVVERDVAFAMAKAEDDPTFYRLLVHILGDEMVGIKGSDYLALFDAEAQGIPVAPLVYRMALKASSWLADLEDSLFAQVLSSLDADCRVQALGECWNRSRQTLLSLVQRTAFLEKLLRGFDALLEADPAEAPRALMAFRDRWGLWGLFHELGVPQEEVEHKDDDALFGLFAKHCKLFLQGSSVGRPAQPPKPPQAPKPAPVVKSLKDRIEEAKNNPAYPTQVIELIEKNKTLAAGHSGAKYSEFIETLLSIPWKKIKPIKVRVQDFEEGLHRTHYGLDRPKEIVCDFFTNLIRRYRQFDPLKAEGWERTGSSFLFVGPPGVGKTSLAISIAQNLGIPYHKISLGGMRDESDLRGHGFTYEGSKPGAIVQGLIKMGCMNGMFILDEADKTEKFAIATLLEILDPEQNHLFHDKYTQTTVDIDLSNCHFILTANTLETVPPPVANRCEIVFLDRYSVEEKVAIARHHLIGRLRSRYNILETDIAFPPDQEQELLRHLVREYTYEAGVRDLERLLRTLFFRIQRKELVNGAPRPVWITRQKIKEYLNAPMRPWKISEEDRVGEILALGVNVERGVGSVIPIQATPIRFGTEVPLESPAGYMSLVHATGNIQKVMDESRKVAMTGILQCADALQIDVQQLGSPIHLHFMGGSSQKDGPSAGGAIALALASALSQKPIRRDVAMTGEIDTHGRLTAVGGIAIKLEAAADAGCTTCLVPKQNLRGEDSIERLPQALKKELQILTYEEWAVTHPPFDYHRHILQVVAVDHIVQAAEVAFIEKEDLEGIAQCLVPDAKRFRAALFSAERTQPVGLTVFVVKDASELPLQALRAIVHHTGMQPAMVCAAPCAEAVKDRLQGTLDAVPIVSMDPQKEKLKEVLTRLLDEAHPLRAQAVAAVVAPFFFLMQDGLLDDAAQGTLPWPEPRFMANNFCVQNAKIKACKPILNAAMSTLAQAPASALEHSPFLGRVRGVWTVDLCFIPEKYRLDTRRAEDLLHGALGAWLQAVFSEAVVSVD
ncbi:S16 family serine protease [Desulfosoma caldarium]|uniref:endopeptidase La n=1 Tax=Desulfosoma caldarium TaxID=610254 RepID=A0A3N1UQH3_9BACT|nr:S16 family serine protease [Desulfosoma caldarium]ROQ93364.1 ATP-dependent Lon protease [Desulfosoma caldarium]